MAIFRNLVTITKASAKAVGGGVEMFADFAERTEKASRDWSLRSRSALMEREFERKAGNGASESELRQIHDELEPIYNELWDISDINQRREISSKREWIQQGLDKTSVREMKEHVALKKQRIDSSAFLKPVDKIEALNRLNGDLKRLSRLVEKVGDKEQLEEISKQHRLNSSLIEELHPKRYEVIETQYPNGTIRTRAHRKDNVVHGLVQFLYPTGQTRYEAQFENGKLVGAYRYWDEGNTLLLRGDALPEGRVEEKVLWNDESVLADVSARCGEVSLSIHLPDGYCLGTLIVSEGRVGKLSFIIPIFFKPGVWKRVLKPSEREKTLLALKKMEENFSIWFSFWRELRSIAK